MNKYTQKTQWERPSAAAKRPEKPEVSHFYLILTTLESIILFENNKININ